MATRLVVSLSGIGTRTLDHCTKLADELDQRGVPLSLLVVPRPVRVDPLAPDSAALRWIQHRRASGDAVLIHGFDHNANPCGGGGLPTPLAPAWWRRAEFATLPAHEAGLRLLAALATFERVGLRTDCFAPPRWLASSGTLTALRRHGFAVCADAVAVHDLRSGAVYRGRVHGLGQSEAAEPWWCWALVLGAARSARRGGLVRLAVDATDLARPGRRLAVLDAVDIALHHGAAPVTYSHLGEAGAAAAA